MRDFIGKDVREFILANIDSIAQLEALLILRNHSPQRWTAKTIAREIYISDQEAAALLTKLLTKGFIVAEDNEPPTYSYQPKTEDIARLIDKLVEMYSKYLVPLTNLVHQRSRRDLVELADAFNLKKKE